MHLDDTLENYLRRTADFHGCFYKAPGIVIGCYMVEYAMELLEEPRGTLNAVVETRVCLTDCVQIMTGCTLGNKHLWLADTLGRYALALYDRDTGEGVRVFLDVHRIDRSIAPDLYAFHLRQRDPRVNTDMAFRKESGLRVVEQFMALKRDCLGAEKVRVLFPRKRPLHPSIPCEQCGEPYLKAPGDPPLCGACSGTPYYEVLHTESESEPDRPRKLREASTA